MPYCGEWTIASDGSHKQRALMMDCRAWNCPNCAPKRQRQLVAEAAGGNPQRFITLTINRPPGETPLEAAHRMSIAWRILCRAINHKYKSQRFEYMAVFEAHKDGWPHLHVLARCRWISFKWLQDTWKLLTGAHRVEIQKVYNAKRAAAYIAKYIGKDPHKFGTLKRYWHSKRWDQRPKREKLQDFALYGVYTLRKYGLVTWMRDHGLDGWEVTPVGFREATAERPP